MSRTVPRLHHDGTTSGGSEDGEYVLRAITAGKTIRLPSHDTRVSRRLPARVRRSPVDAQTQAYGVDRSRLLRQYGFSSLVCRLAFRPAGRGRRNVSRAGRAGNCALLRGNHPVKGSGDADSVTIRWDVVVRLDGIDAKRKDHRASLRDRDCLRPAMLSGEPRSTPESLSVGAGIAWRLPACAPRPPCAAGPEQLGAGEGCASLNQR